MDRKYKLYIARMAYKEIKEAIDKFEQENGIDISTHWDECISVDGELFHGNELREELYVKMNEDQWKEECKIIYKDIDPKAAEKFDEKHPWFGKDISSEITKHVFPKNND